MRAVVHSLKEESGGEVIAAVDLGSNSFHMVVGELRHGQLTIIDRIRETVRIAEGLEKNGALSLTAGRRAIDCLSRFGERLKDMHASTVRAAGTSALRRASDSKRFREEAENALGHPIEVISGIEEARLIYNGVNHSMPPYDGMRLVVDIGGGSTELILGEGPTPKALESLHMGCVVMTEAHFPDGRVSADNFLNARIAARLMLRPVKSFFRDATGLDAVGTSGTIRATESVARELGIIETSDLTVGAVEALIARVLEFKNISDISLPGLSERRAQVWPGGLAVLIEILLALRLPRIRISDGALREGLLYELSGRMRHEDARERSVLAMAGRFHVDQAQAERVAQTAAALLQKCKVDWRVRAALAAQALDWASRLHEIGLDIAHDGYHRHGAYIVANADMPGFPRNEQAILAFMILNQRGATQWESAQTLPAGWREPATRLAILLRLAALLNRSRSSQGPPPPVISTNGYALRLEFSQAWLDHNPLSVADLERETRYLRQAGYELTFGPLPLEMTQT